MVGSTANDGAAMSLEAFARLAEIWGGALERWPAEHRAAAADLVARSGEAAAILERERHLDAALDADPAPALSTDLAARMLADAASVASGRAAEAARLETVREPVLDQAGVATGFGAFLRDMVRALGGGAVAAGLGGAATLAAAAGFVIGLETQSATVDETRIAMSETIFSNALSIADESEETGVFSFGEDASL